MYPAIYTIGTLDDSTRHVVSKSNSIDRKPPLPVKVISNPGTHVYVTQLVMFLFSIDKVDEAYFSTQLVASKNTSPSKDNVSDSVATGKHCIQTNTTCLIFIFS